MTEEIANLTKENEKTKDQTKTIEYERTIEDLKQDLDIKARIVKKLLSEKHHEATNPEPERAQKRRAIIIGDPYTQIIKA